MEKVHSRINWENYPSIATPLNEANLNKMDKALDEVDNRVLGLDTAKLDKSTANTMVKDVTFDESTGIFTVTLLNGTAKTINTKLEKVVTNFRYDNQSQKLVLTLADGSEQQVDLSSLISNYEFADGNIITFIIGSDGKVTANVKDGSITETKLQPNFLANVKTEVAKAKSYADSSYENATTSRNAVTEAKQYRDEALQFRNEAESFAPEGYADLVDQVNENTVKVDTIIAKADLGIKETASGEEIHLTDSAEGKAVEFALYGKAKQNTTTGKNLLKNIATSQTVNGLTFTVNNDGSITVNGTATTETKKDINHNFSYIEGKTYKMVGCPKGGSDTTYMIKIYGGFGVECGEGNIFTPTSNMAQGISIIIKSGITCNNLVFKPMLTEDLTLNYENYEPYTNGASPNPQYPQPIEVSGESYNLLENTATTQTINGVEFVVNEDGSVTANGTATANASINIILSTPLVSDNYIFSGVSGGNADTYFMDLYAEGWTKNVVLLNGERTLSQEVAIVRIVVKSGYKAENITFYPMIRKASVKNDRYMPYGKGSVEVKNIGKNWFDGLLEEGTLNLGTGGVQSNSERQRSANFINVKENTAYTLSSNENIINLNAVFYDKNYAYISKFVTTNGFVTPSNCSYMKFYGEKGTNTAYDLTDKNIQLELGNVATPYQPYKETLSTIPTENGLAGIKVSSGGNYTDANGQQWICDEIVKYADGSGEYVQRVEKIIFDGSEDEYWKVMEINVNTSRFVIDSIVNVKKSPSNALSNLFTYKTGHNYGIGSVDYCCFAIRDDLHGFTIRVPSTITTVSELRTFLTSNILTIMYILAEPIITPLTAEEIAEIEKLHTFYPITNISNDFDCGMKVTYNCDSKNYIDNKIALLTTAMINNI